MKGEEKRKKLFNAVDESHPFHSVNRMKHNNTLYGQNVEFRKVNVGG